MKCTNEPDEDAIDNEENILIEMSKLLRNLVQSYYSSLKGLLGKEIFSFFILPLLVQLFVTFLFVF